MPSTSVLLVGGNDFPFHRIDAHGDHLAAAFDDHTDVTVTTAKDALTDLAPYDAVVDYLTDSTLTDAQRDGLLSFVADGGGYLGVHCAADLTTTDTPGARDAPFPELRDLLGGHFVTHPDQTTFHVRVVDHYHPVTAGLDDFAVWDEPYVVDVDDDVRVLARMDHPDHADTPVLWVKPYGDGRVCYCSLGHATPALTTDGTRTILRNALRWTTAQH